MGQPLNNCRGRQVSRGKPCGRILKSPGEVLVAVIAGENSRTTMPTPGRVGPPKLYDKGLSKEVATVSLVRKLYVRHDMGWAEGGRHPSI